MAKTRILLVDDHDIVRLGLMTLLNDQPDMEVVAEASTAAEAVRAVEKYQPNVVLMDIRLPGDGGIEAIIRAISAGAVGYVLKQVGNEELLRAIRAAARGEASFDPSTTAKLISRVREFDRKSEEDAFRELSDREMDVLVHVARGKTNAEIGHLLNLSEKTVGNYIGTMFEKLHLNNRIELAIYAVEHHLFERMGKE